MLLQAILLLIVCPGKVLALLSKPEVKLVTLTITEKGYCCNVPARALIEDHPDVVHDLVM